MWKLENMSGFVNNVIFINGHTESHFYFSHIDGDSCKALIKRNGNIFSTMTRDQNYKIGFSAALLIKSSIN